MKIHSNKRVKYVRRKANHYIFRNNEVRRTTLREKQVKNEAKRVWKKLAKMCHASMLIITGNHPKMPMFEPGMLTYENTPSQSRVPCYEISNTELIVSDESRKRILARLNEISECVMNCGVKADELGKKLREFAMEGNPWNTPDGKPL